MRGRQDGRDAAWSHCGAQRHLRQRLEILAQLGWNVDDDLLVADHRRGTGLDRDVLCDLDMEDPHRCIGGFWDRGRPARGDGLGGVLCADGVGLAPQTSVSSVSSDDLDGADLAAARGAGESGAVGAGSFDAEGELATERSEPVDRLGVAARVSNERTTLSRSTEVVDGERKLDLFVGVDGTGDRSAAFGVGAQRRPLASFGSATTKRSGHLAGSWCVGCSRLLTRSLGCSAASGPAIRNTPVITVGCWNRYSLTDLNVAPIIGRTAGRYDVPSDGTTAEGC